MEPVNPDAWWIMFSEIGAFRDHRNVAITRTNLRDNPESWVDEIHDYVWE